MNPWLAMALVWVFVGIPVGCLVGMYPGWLARRDRRRRYDKVRIEEEW